jgi:predicted nucleotide-binding protein (sugar kinase/HSP70/actin superfamily)
MLGISVTNGEFADLAFKAPYTIDLGTRCAAFMAQAVASAQQQGMPLEIIVASLSTAIAKNYLSKVVGNRRLGDKVILTGAVFYNRAVVSAFHSELGERELIVPEHKEISGAIGAALLAKEQMAGRKSSFRGFQKVVDSKCTLTSFVCKGCDNNCTITRMQMPGEKTTYYGSRCDRYDSDATHAKKLNALDVRCVLSSQTSKEIVEKSLELSYTDSCFPLKLLHGHAAMLEDTDYILYPSAIRLGIVKGDENQKYSCPLVQAAPYIIRSVIGLEERILTPTIDFSQGDGDVIKNLTEAAVKMGFSKKQGKAAAMAGINSLRKFELDQANLGKEILEELHQGDKLGVVLFARSYMSQDAGANLGIAEKMAQLGVVPIPLDFLPLASIDPQDYSDRPYWFYESKYIAGAALTVSDPKLFGLALTNFGCGPNSFMLPIVEDIMGDKPFGQLEIDEHAAEAGIVTRIEAYVDTIKGFAHSVPHYAAPERDIYRGVSSLEKSHKKFIIPDMSVHAEFIAAAMQAYGINAVTLPEANEQNLLYADRVTSGVECLPYRVTLGGFMRYYYDNGHDVKDVEAFMAGAYGPCRFGKYAIEQIRTLKDLGIDLPMRTATSNNAYRDVNLGLPFMRLAWKAGLTGDFMYKLLRRSRPYEREAGAAEALFKEYTRKFAEHIRKKGSLTNLQRQATADFKALIDPEIPRKPLVGINGEIFLRSNKFSNNNMVKVCENAGLEIVVSSIGEWLKYIIFRHIEDAARYRDIKKLISGYVLKYTQDHDERSIEKAFKGLIEEREPTIAGVLSKTEQWLSTKCGSEAVLSIGTGIEWMENPEIAGVISVMPHGCMPGGIVAAMSGRFSELYGKPWINLTYDGFQETNNLDRINNFAEIIRFCNKGTVKDAK